MDNDLIKRVNNIRTNIRNLKTNQVVGGDSWVVYRTKVDFTHGANVYYRVDFTPDVSGNFVAKAFWTTQDRVLYGSDRELIPDPNYSGRWYYVRRVFGNINETIFIYSTKKGTITLTNLSTPNQA